MEAERKVRRIGNSLGIHIPISVVRSMGLETGDIVYVSYENEKMIVSKQRKSDSEEDLKQEIVKVLDEYFSNNETK